MSSKHANPAHPIHELAVRRWSPYAFADRPVATADLCSLFEAARWAPSAYNEQPWRYIVATREDAAAFERLLTCLVGPNQAWARAAPVLALGVVRRTYAHDGSENRTATHDLGLASAQLVFEATARGLAVHQMGGILPDQARELYHIPTDYQAWTALAIGYLGDPNSLPEPLRQRDLAPRQRRPLAEFVFSGDWAQPAAFAST